MKQFLLLLLTCLVVQTQAQSPYNEAMTEGEKLMKTGYYPQAIGAFSKAIDLNPKSYMAFYDRALAKKTNGDQKGALQDYTVAIQLNPLYYDALLNRGVLYDEMGNTKSAMEDYKNAIALDPNKAVAYNNRGFALYRKRDLQNALTDFNTSIQKDSLYITPYINKLAVLEALGKGDLLVDHCELMLRKFPKDPTCYLNVAQSYIVLQDYPNATFFLDRAIALNPGFYEAYIARSKLRDDHGYDDEGAIADASKAISIDPSKAMAYYIRSRPKYDTKDHAGVIADCNKAVELNPDFYEAIIMRGNSYDIIGKTELALKDYDKCIALKPYEFEAYFQKSVTLVLQERYPEVVTMLDEALKKLPKSDSLRMQNYQCKLLMKKHADALRELDVMVDHHPNDDMFYFERGKLKDTLKDKTGRDKDLMTALQKGNENAYTYIKAHCPELQKQKDFKYFELVKSGMDLENAGEFTKAIAQYDLAVQLAPEKALAYYNRGISKRKLQKFKEAIDDYLKAIEREPKSSVAYTSAAVSAYYLNDLEGAIGYNMKAIEVDSANAMSYYNTAGIYFEKKEYTKAIPLLEKAVFYKKDYAKAYTLMGECLEMLNEEEKACFCYRAGEFYGDREATGKRVWACRKK